MIAYNKGWLDNKLVNEEIDQAFEKQLISNEEKARVSALFTVGFYTPNHFIRIGLFILACIIASFSLGLICLVFLSSVESMFSGLLLLFGIGAYAMLEYFVRTKHHYRSGVDDALMWIAGGAIFSSVMIMTSFSFTSGALIVLLLAAYFTVRFADMLMAALAVIAFVSLFFYKYNQLGNFAKATTPFVLMAIAAVIYLLTKKNGHGKMFKYYSLCNIMVQIVSLVLFYASGNYFIVREVSNEMFDLNLQPGQTIMYGWLFWILTFIIPLLYIVWGVRKKDLVLLRVGLLLIAAIVFTVRYYHSLWPIETVMLFGGVVMVAIAYTLTRWLAKPRMGFTSEEAKDKFIMDKLNVEALVIVDTIGQTTAPDSKFGGGSFGGGGSSGEY